MSAPPAGLRPVRTTQPADRPRLTVVPAPRRRAPRAPFVLLVVTLLSAGLIGLLLLNTALAQDSFRLADLRAEAAELSDRTEVLQREVADLEAPQRLAETARALGLVPHDDVQFLRTPGGEVLGSNGSDE